MTPQAETVLAALRRLLATYPFPFGLDLILEHGETGLDRRAIRGALAELVAAGLVMRRRWQPQKNRRGTVEQWRALLPHESPRP